MDVHSRSLHSHHACGGGGGDVDGDHGGDLLHGTLPLRDVPLRDVHLREAYSTISSQLSQNVERQATPGDEAERAFYCLARFYGDVTETVRHMTLGTPPPHLALSIIQNFVV